MIDELQTLMDFHSVSNDQAAVGRLLDYVEFRVTQKGLTVERLEHDGIQSLYASVNGAKHARVMLQAHIDVVPGGENFLRQDGKIYGRGCYDMLFATASYLHLIDTLDDIQAYDISLLLTGDEELGGERGVGTIMNTPDYSCDICILPDAGEGLGTLSVGAKGLWQMTLQVDGRSHHASRPWEGDNAAMKLVQFLDEFSKEFTVDDKMASTMTVAQLQSGGVALNQGPSTATAGIDIRFTDTDDLGRLQGALQRLKEKYHVTITHEQQARAYSINTDHPDMQAFIRLYGEMANAPVRLHRSHGSSDTRFFDEKNIPVIMFRPDGGNAHGDDEWLSVGEWIQFHDILTSYVEQTALRPAVVTQSLKTT